MVTRGHVKNGVVVLDNGVRLPEDQEVTVLAPGAWPAVARSRPFTRLAPVPNTTRQPRMRSGRRNRTPAPSTGIPADVGVRSPLTGVAFCSLKLAASAISQPDERAWRHRASCAPEMACERFEKTPGPVRRPSARKSISVASVGSTPIPDVNLLAQDSIGWPAYVRQVTGAYDALPDRAHAAVFTSNYGEAGAVHHYRPDVPVYSAQNALYDRARPPDRVTTVVVVGGQYDEVRPLFDRCQVRTHLDDEVEVDNEEQGLPVAVCTGPTAPWSTLWPRLHHLD